MLLFHGEDALTVWTHLIIVESIYISTPAFFDQSYISILAFFGPIKCGASENDQSMSKEKIFCNLGVT